MKCESVAARSQFDLLVHSQKLLDESHSDINEAFGPRRSVSSPYIEHPVLASLLEIKNDLSAEVRALSNRMSHIDEQISQIFHFLSPAPSSTVHHPVATSTSAPPSPSASSSLLAPKTKTSTIIDIDSLSRPTATAKGITKAPSPRSVMDDDDSTALCIAPPPSVYNRSSIVSLGISTTPRGSVSNKIAPAPQLPSSASSKQPSSTTFRPISNTRYNPGHSPKPKIRSKQTRSAIKQRQQSDSSTIIDLESDPQAEDKNRAVPLLSTTRSSGQAFRRFMTGGTNPERNIVSSSTLLYPPTSDDDHPMSPASSGNDDDDYRPLTSSSSHKHHHHTPL